MAEHVAADKQTQEQKRRELWKSALFRWLVFVQMLVLFAFAYVHFGDLLIQQTNSTHEEMFMHDQMHNLRLATQTHEDLRPNFNKGVLKPLENWFPHRTDGVVNPLWPWMAAWMVEDGHEITEAAMRDKVVTERDRKLFKRGREAQVFLSLGFLIMLGIGACRLFSLPAACNLVLLGGFGAFLPRAAYFQPEPVYFIFFFLTWVACMSALHHNSLWIYTIIGVLSGIAYMAKGSIAPLLGVFVLVSSLRCIWEFFSAQRRGLQLAGAHLWHWRNHLVGIVFLGAAHLMTIGPRLTDAQEKFGDMFHSYASYWMWMDSFGGTETINDSSTGYGWMDKHRSRDELTVMLPQDRPSLTTYLHTHTGQEALDRLWNGTRDRLEEFAWPKQTKRKTTDLQKGWRGILEWRGLYLAWLFAALGALVIVLVAAAPKPEHAGHIVFRHGSVTTILFVAGTCAAYALAYGWYAPIAHGSGDRFMLSLYLPLAFSIIWGAETIVRRLRRRKGSAWIQRGYQATQWILFCAINWRLVEILRHPLFYHK